MPPLVDLGLNLKGREEGECRRGRGWWTPSHTQCWGSGGGLPGLLVEDDGEGGEGLVVDTVDPSEGSQCLGWGRSSWARQRQACRGNGGHEDNYGERQG